MSFELLGDAAAELLEILINREKPKPAGQKMTVQPSSEKEPEITPEPEVKPALHPIRLTIDPANTGAALGLQANPAVFQLNSSNIVQAVVFSELLSEPICKRRRRWRSWS